MIELNIKSLDLNVFSYRNIPCKHFRLHQVKRVDSSTQLITHINIKRWFYFRIIFSSFFLVEPSSTFSYFLYSFRKTLITDRMLFINRNMFDWTKHQITWFECIFLLKYIMKAFSSTSSETNGLINSVNNSYKYKKMLFFAFFFLLFFS